MFKRLNNLRTFELSQSGSRLVVSIVLLLWYDIWVSLSRPFCSALVTRMEETKGDFSSTHNPWKQRRKSLSMANLLSLGNYGLIQSNSKDGRNGGIIYKLPKRLRYSHSCFPNWARTYLCPSSFKGRILPISRFNKVRNDLDSILGCLSSHGVMTSTIRLLGQKNTTPVRPDEKYIILIPPPGVVQTKGTQASPQSHLVSFLLDDLGFSYESSNILSMFLLNTNLHAIQDFNYL